jgi:hypothetical protein
MRIYTREYLNVKTDELFVGINTQIMLIDELIRRYELLNNAEFERKHPRDDDGKFGEGRGKAKERIFKPDARAEQRFKKEVKRIIDDDKIPASTLIDMGTLPPVFKAIGLKEKQLKTNKFALLKAEGRAGKNPHNVKREDIENLLVLLSDPVAVFKSLPTSKNPKGYVAVLSGKDKSGRQLVAILSPSKDGKGYTFIPTVYGREDFKKFLKNNKKAKTVLYIKDKSLKGFSEQFRSSPQGSDNNIATKEDIVKWA